IEDVCQRRIRRADAAEILGLSVRHIQRLMNRLASGLAHRARGKPSNHRYSSGYRNSVLSLVRENYSDFSPTFALEKLTELQIYQS
ncbi:ISNCY family transposase, partial [Vibrio cyclitrophicus]